jgi:hypothetical protein
MRGGGPSSHKQGVSYTNLVFGLAMTLKLDIIIIILLVENSTYVICLSLI